jgi:hypothetical protein
VLGIVAVIAALAAVMVAQSADDRVPVVAVARDVPQGQEITAEDLTVAEVAQHPALSPVPSSRMDALVGQFAAVELRAGTLLTSSQVTGDNVLPEGERLVGVEAARSQMPLDVLVPGDEVLVVHTPGEGSVIDDVDSENSEGSTTISATVRSLSDPDDDGTGERMVNLSVTATDAPVLAGWAAAGEVTLVMEPRG